jgi:hypothetical protein
MIHNHYLKITDVPLATIQADLAPIGRAFGLTQLVACERDGAVCVEIHDEMAEHRTACLLSMVFDKLIETAQQEGQQ